MINIDVIRQGEFRNDVAIQASLLSLMAPSYKDPVALIARELAHCNTLYLTRDAEGEVVCFFLVSWETLEIPEQGIIPALYLGLSAMRQGAKNSGYISLLYSRCIAEAVDWEANAGERLILWGTTAIPVVYLAVNSFLSQTEPYPDGSYTTSGSQIANAIRYKLGETPNNGHHPFALKGIASDTRYSQQEIERIQQMCLMKKFTLFQELGINETNGDRLLFISRVP